MSDMNAFFTRDAANEGIKVPLTLPDGTRSEHFIIVRGIDSDAFREADALAKRNAIQHAFIEDENERKKAFEAEKRVLIGSLISDWSFDEPCNPDNIENFLKQAPQICDQIDQAAAKRSLFFKKK